MKRWIALLLVLVVAAAALPVMAAADTAEADSAYYTIRLACDQERGIIIPGGEVSVPAGGRQTFYFEPNEGYEAVMVLVDGYPISHVYELERHCKTCNGCEECDWIDWTRVYDGFENDDWSDWQNELTFFDVNADHVVFVDFAPVEETEAPSETESESTSRLDDYTDLNPDAWYAEAVNFALEQKLMDGMGGGRFMPDGTVTRAQLVTMLWRMEDRPDAGMERSAFADVEKDAWYAPAVEWAADMELVTGYNGMFRPNDPITREQLAAILWRFAKLTGLDVSVGENTNILSYHDAFDVSEYACAPLQWACGAGVMNGSNGSLMPQGHATRAQAAAMLFRLEQLTAEAVNS